MTISVGGSIVLSGAGLLLQALGYRLADPHHVVLFWLSSRSSYGGRYCRSAWGWCGYWRWRP